MVNARLHLICGNCGCNDEWEWEHVVDSDEQSVWIWCLNCSTLHSLDDNARQKQEQESDDD